ncbi:MAG: PDZ domain-containing protein [Clostridiales bacterium]|nr:PDZ domain-containing protein [Clostridiales bacterium]
MKKSWVRPVALLLVCALLLAPAAGALTVEQARELLGEHYVEEISEEILALPTIGEILEALGDPYTRYMDAEAYAAFLAGISDEEVVGIGVSGYITGEGFLVDVVYDGTPAQLAGLASGDLIVAVDGEPVTGDAAETAPGRLRGAEDATLTIRVRRTDGTYETLSMARERVVFSTTTSTQPAPHVAVISCHTFNENTRDRFVEATEAYGKTARQWIVDLRDNIGGDVDAAVQSSGVFLGEGTIAYVRHRGSYYRYLSTQPMCTLYPLVVLSNQGTASAAEMFLSAVRDAGGGILIGSRSYGKGVAQALFDEASAGEAFFPEGDAMNITVYHYFSLGGNAADQIGVIPHLLVPDDRAEQVAHLLCAPGEETRNEGLLRVHAAGWRWFVDVETAVSEAFRPAFTSLLEALPPGAVLYRGEGDGVWTRLTAGEAAGRYGLEDYAPRVFSDVEASAYRDEINTLKTFDILRGGSDGCFYPEEHMTRAELCAMIAQAVGEVPAVTEAPFPDVPADAWYAPGVAAAVKMGLVAGDEAGLFHPMDTVDHEQMIAVMARFVSWLNIGFYELSVGGAADEALADEALAGYSDWARESVWLLSKTQRNPLGGELNLLFAPPDEIEAAGPALRGEAAALLCTLLSYTGVLCG